MKPIKLPAFVYTEEAVKLQSLEIEGDKAEEMEVIYAYFCRIDAVYPGESDDTCLIYVGGTSFLVGLPMEEVIKRIEANG